MNIDHLTKEDLEILKKELLAAIKSIQNQSQQNEWLRSADVRKMLGISAGTLQTLRINGTIPYSPLGGTLYYSRKAIEKVLEENMRNLMPASSI